MATKVDSLAEGALELTEDQRLTLAHRILVSTEPKPDSEVSAWWEVEIARRIDLLDAGATERIAASEVLRELDSRFRT